MNKFYFYLWLGWSLRITICSVILAFLFSLLITIVTYITSSATSLDAKILYALVDVLVFWFTFVWSLSLLIALFRSIKYIFNRCIGGYELKLLTCSSHDVIDVVGYGDLVKVWRKWFMLLIWLVASMMIVSLVVTYMLSDFTSIFDWFNIFWLYGFIIISGYFSFILMIAKCKRVELIKC